MESAFLEECKPHNNVGNAIFVRLLFSPSEPWPCTPTKGMVIERLVKHYAFDGTCAHCCRDFHGRARLCAHLRVAPTVSSSPIGVFSPAVSRPDADLGLA